MFPLAGLPTFFDAVLPERSATAVVFAIPSVVFLILLWSLFVTKKDLDSAPVWLSKYSFSVIRPFFQTRFEFIRWGFQLTGQSIYQFNLLRNTIVAVSGEPGRRDFFSSRELDINEGFKVLSGAIPMLPGVTSDLQARRISVIHKRLAGAQNSDRLAQLLPQILDDAQKVMELWGTSGTVDPFDAVPKVIFQTTVRSLSCYEMADDPILVARLKTLYDELDSSTTPASVLLPWVPSPSMVRKLIATKRVYDIVSAAINARTESGVSRDDTLQMLLDHADDRLVIVGFIMGLLVAGARSTGTTASWMITFLGGHSEWKEKATLEIQNLLHCHSNLEPENPFKNKTSSHLSSLSTRLATIPLEIWESETPVLDCIIRETLRVAQPHTAMRRNVGPDMYISGKMIPTGTYVVYPFSDVHLNEELYPNPWKFDPARPEHKHPFSYLGWGGGSTICLGQRLAKLELKLITALWLTGFDYCVVDRRGMPLEQLPRPNWNDSLTCKPPKGSCFLAFECTNS